MRVTKLQSYKCIECSGSWSECVRCLRHVLLWSHRWWCE